MNGDKRTCVRLRALVSTSLALLCVFTFCAPASALAQKIVGGNVHTLALRADGRLWAWGYNYYGQLGDGTKANKSSPVQVLLPAGVSKFTAMAAGKYHSLALTADGKLWAWGYNDDGQLGDGTNIDKSSPVEITPAGVSFTAVAAGAWHSLALAADGKIWAWGYNGYGLFGDGDTVDSLIPKQVPLPAGVSKFTTVAAGYEFSLALADDGTLWAWGKNESGQLGDGSNVDKSSPVQVPLPAGVSKFTAMAAGAYHSLGLADNGTLWAWGNNSDGRLGDGSNVGKSSPVQVPLPAGVSKFTAVAGGYNHSLALADDGTFWAWGYNNKGQLGDGTIIDKRSPVQVPLPSGVSGFTVLAAGGYHSLALTPDGTLWTWGNNTYGRLGDGTTVDKSSPVQTKGPDGNGCLDLRLAIFPHGAQGEAPLTVSFSSSHTSLATAERWDFGDGHTSSGTTASHTFDTPGLYTVTFSEDVPGGTPITTSTQDTTITVQVLDSGSGGGGGGGSGGGSGSGGGGGGGCALSPSASPGLEWLLLFAPVLLSRLRRKP